VLGKAAGKVGGDAGIKAAVPAAQYVGVIRRSSRPLVFFRISIPQFLKDAQLFGNRQLPANFPREKRSFKNVAKSIAGDKNV